MNRKDAELIARTLAYCEAHCDNEEESAIVEWVTEHITEAIKREHPRFDGASFIRRANPLWMKKIATPGWTLPTLAK